MNCSRCDKTDGLVYTSFPPKFKCTITGKFHVGTDDCDVEFVSVVRCKDCKLYKPIDDYSGKCPFLIGNNQFKSPDGYCDLGERKDG